MHFFKLQAWRLGTFCPTPNRLYFKQNPSSAEQTRTVLEHILLVLEHALSLAAKIRTQDSRSVLEHRWHTTGPRAVHSLSNTYNNKLCGMPHIHTPTSLHSSVACHRFPRKKTLQTNTFLLT